MIKVGTSGYSFDDWSGVIYPESLESGDYLSHYGTYFNTVELNFPYYRMPDPQIFLALMKKVPDDFDFSVKLTKEFTHEREKIKEAIEPYREGIQPLLAHDRLATLLAQFPYSFKPCEESFNHLRRIRDELEGIPINVEFRNEYWINEETFRFLAENDLGYVCVDMPKLSRLVPPVVRVTNGLGYIRFHGRVKKHWWDPPEPHKRYDYLYRREELEEWIPKVRELSEEAKSSYLFFNNHFQGKSAKNAALMTDLLDLQPPEINRTPEEMDFLGQSFKDEAPGS